MTRFLRRVLRIAAPLLLAACGGEYAQSSLDPKTDFGEVIQGLYVSVFWWTLAILAVVWAILAYVLIRFRARPGDPLPKQTHGHLGMEIAWTLGPTLIVVAIAIPTIQAVFETQRGDPENSYVVEVVGRQFWWEFRYPEDGVITANELRLPVGRRVSLRLHSEDVVHSFWVPQLGGKRDVNPLVQKPEGGVPRYNWLHFTINEAGVYRGQCAEFCGSSHALMGTYVIAEPEGDFEAWVNAWRAEPSAPSPDDGAPAPSPEDALVAEGRQVFQTSTCIICHAVQGTPAQGRIGPDLTLFGSRGTLGAGWLENTQDNVEHWITDPASVKPGVRMPGTSAPGGNWPPTGLSGDQVRAVAAYLLSLR